MLKKILTYTVAAIALGYLGFALLFLTGKEEGELCKGIDIEIHDKGYGAISVEEIEELIQRKNGKLAGEPLDEIDCSKLELLINSLSVVEECQCFKTHKGFVGMNITCKIPILQVYDIDGREFCIDKKGDIIEGINSAVYLPVASGFINRTMAKKELLVLAEFLNSDRFWNEQIEQIFFTAKGDILLIPRIGNHTIELGKIENIEKKLDKLRKFYEKGLNTVGWNKYKRINIEFEEQVICTKKQ